MRKEEGGKDAMGRKKGRKKPWKDRRVAEKLCKEEGGKKGKANTVLIATRHGVMK